MIVKDTMFDSGIIQADHRLNCAATMVANDSRNAKIVDEFKNIKGYASRREIEFNQKKLHSK